MVKKEKGGDGYLLEREKEEEEEKKGRGKRRGGESVTLEITPKEVSEAPGAPFHSSMSISNPCPLCHFALPYSGESNSVQWAFIANNPVLGVV